MQHIGFTLNDKEYTIPILRVKEIIKSPSITRLPLVPLYVEGVTNLRGKILAVLNLKKLVGLDGGTVGDKVVVVASGRVRFGFFVDTITGLITIDDSEITSACDMRTKHLECVVQVGNRLVTPLNPKELIPTEDVSLKDEKGGNLFIDPDAN